MGLLEEAARAKEHFQSYLQEMDRAFEMRQRQREADGTKVVAFCGHGRHGKDTCGEIWESLTGAKYVGSVSAAVLPLVSWTMGIERATCWATRHEHREFWKQFCDALRADDPTLLLRLVLADADVVCGIRARAEFWSGWGEGLFDYVAWVHRPGVPDDPTYDFSSYDQWRFVPEGAATRRGKFYVSNDGSLEDLRATLEARASELGLLKERSI